MATKYIFSVYSADAYTSKSHQVRTIASQKENT